MLLDNKKYSVINAIWKLYEVDEKKVLNIVQKLKIPKILAKILTARSIDIKNINNFLHPTIKSSLPNPFHLLDMKKAICRIILAINNSQNIAIFGDYDVDGATSSALINKYLKTIGIQSTIYIPNRINEGYGLNTDALLQLKKKGTDLCISVDCGTLAYQPIENAKNFGLDIIVIDHHLCTEKLPNAVAIINPNRLDENSPCTNLAAVGVTFLLIIALNSSLRKQGFFIDKEEPNLFNLLDLVALGTICDVMQITGLNRAFVSQGLKIISEKKNIGLRVLLNSLKIFKKLNVSQLSFNIGPCINAGGRIGEASLGAKLLSTESEKEAHSITLELINLNNRRKKMENKAVLEAITQTKKLIKLGTNFIMVSGKWHQGIIGIIASKLKDKFYLPTIVISLNYNEIGKASCRSIPGVNIGATIHSAKLIDLIIEGGGHSAAAGFIIKKNKINDLYNFFTKKFKHFTYNKTLKVDDIITTKTVNLSFWNQLQRLEPFGVGNPEPRFVIKNVKIKNPKIIAINHIKCFISDGHAIIKAIAFHSVNTHLGFAIMNNNIKAVLGKISMDYLNNNIQFLIEDALTID
ncbi:MAG: single-stranded-DNA-specific exonuclease RecJ [Wolbachia endosymbiont of Menacanthus eurysternus]|nr:MAG: single-stranded-DNA-specific exonuclease RecJ [Wolbachia endosymbiont of Menacanthus eurysternus]